MVENLLLINGYKSTLFFDFQCLISLFCFLLPFLLVFFDGSVLFLLYPLIPYCLCSDSLEFAVFILNLAQFIFGMQTPLPIPLFFSSIFLCCYCHIILFFVVEAQNGCFNVFVLSSQLCFKEFLNEKNSLVIFIYSFPIFCFCYLFFI